MTIAEYIVDYLVKKGVTDVFGIPGGVILPLLKALNDRKEEIAPHLNYHEQMAGFAACGYAQASHKLGVAYATRGPGITNMLTCMAEAYQESLPVLFITAHSNRNSQNVRFEYDQEMDITHSVSSYTKYACTVDKSENVERALKMACYMALEGRKGPVFLDISTKLWNEQIVLKDEYDVDRSTETQNSDWSVRVKRMLEKAKRPVILVGDGIRQADMVDKVYSVISEIDIPIISSRAAQDIMAKSRQYFGYVGSHGTRYANFILAKSDLIIAIGNRLSFPTSSDSFKSIVDNIPIIRVDIDENELGRVFPNSVVVHEDVSIFVDFLEKNHQLFGNVEEWIKICYEIKNKLNCRDITQPVVELCRVLKAKRSIHSYVCDVGNNEFWFSRAYEYVRPLGQVLYSKAFGTLGCALGKAIGVYYATREAVMCIMGDQGFQYNIQELQYISQWNLPITIVIVNNNLSGMIRDNEKKIMKEEYVHVSAKDGYRVPNFEAISKAYNIPYSKNIEEMPNSEYTPLIMDITVDESVSLTPNLPKGNKIYEMEPLIESKLYDYLTSL